MEKLKDAIRKLESNFKEVIDCHSKNLESLKNITLELNERGVALEKSGNKVHSADLSVVRKDLTKLEGKMDSVEEKLLDGFKSTTKKQKEDREMLKELLEDNDRKIREVDEIFINTRRLLRNMKIKLNVTNVVKILSKRLT